MLSFKEGGKEGGTGKKSLLLWRLLFREVGKLILFFEQGRKHKFRFLVNWIRKSLWRFGDYYLVKLVD